MYYLRTKSAADAVKFTVQETKTEEQKMAEIQCSLDDPDGCISCGS
jgi:ribonucleoside-diphosphate reductase alpha chain